MQSLVFFKILSLYFFLFFLLSCSHNDALPGYSGNSGEVIIVMDEKYWNSLSGETVKNKLAQAQYGLPQDEPVFKIIHVPSKNFTKIFQTHRNILITDFSENYKEIKSEILMNSWAKGQIVIKITSPSEPFFTEFMNSYSENIINKFCEKEIERQMKKNKTNGETINKIIDNVTLKSFSVSIQKDSYIAKEDSNFLWIRLERGRNQGGYEHQISQGVFIYWQNYTDTFMFSPDKIIADNDSVSRKFISGSVANSFMTTSFKQNPPLAKKTMFNNMYAVEIRGLWRMENDFMGGPFFSLSFLDEKNNKIITAEGYVFAPQFDKLLYLREVEAMVKSVKVN